MFDFYDVGAKMKKIARRFGTIGIILSIIYGFFTGYSIIKAGKMTVSIYDESAAVPSSVIFSALLAGAIIIAAGCLCAYLSAMLWHSIGDCAENSEKMLLEIHSLKKSLDGKASSNSTNTPTKSEANGHTLLYTSNNQSNATPGWTCKKCGFVNRKEAFFCKDCGEHR